jgi:hypothetical protein
MSRTEVTFRVGLLELMAPAVLGEVELLLESSIEPFTSILWLTSFDRSSLLPDSFKPLAHELGAVLAEPVVPAVDVLVLALADGCAFISTYCPPDVSAVVEGEGDGLGVVPVVPAAPLPDWRQPVTVTVLLPLIRSL